MDKFFTLLIKGTVGLIWMLATVITSVLLSPFILITWISKFLGKRQKNIPEEEEKVMKPQELSHYDY
jgi:F0F1-type ATP synthase membrane subunit b/b'